MDGEDLLGNVRESGNSSSEDRVFVNCLGFSSQGFEGLLVVALLSFDLGGGSRPFPSHFSKELRDAIIQGCREKFSCAYRTCELHSLLVD